MHENEAGKGRREKSWKMEWMCQKLKDSQVNEFLVVIFALLNDAFIFKNFRQSDFFFLKQSVDLRRRYIVVSPKHDDFLPNPLLFDSTVWKTFIFNEAAIDLKYIIFAPLFFLRFPPNLAWNGHFERVFGANETRNNAAVWMSQFREKNKETLCKREVWIK